MARSKTVEYGSANVRMEVYKVGRTEKVVDVYLDSGVHWPTDYELAVIADGGDPSKGTGLFRSFSVTQGDHTRHKVVTLVLL